MTTDTNGPSASNAAPSTPALRTGSDDAPTFLLGATLDSIIPGTEETWPTFGIRFSFFVESHDITAVERERERLWDTLADVVAAAAEGGSRFEYRLALEGPVTGKSEKRVQGFERAADLANYWEGLTSQSTGESGRVEFRVVSEWQKLEPTEDPSASGPDTSTEPPAKPITQAVREAE